MAQQGNKKNDADLAQHRDFLEKQFGGGGKLIIGPEKDRFVQSRIPFYVTECVQDFGGGFQGGDRWLLEIKAEGKERQLSFPCNDKRDEVFMSLHALTNAGEAYGPVILTKSGNAYYISLLRRPSSSASQPELGD